MPLRLSTLCGLIACGLLMASCASKSASPPAPMLTLPAVARTPCQIPTLPDSPTHGDLEVTYLARGQMLAICEGRRSLAVEAFDAQIKALTPPPRPWWRRVFGD